MVSVGGSPLGLFGEGQFTPMPRQSKGGWRGGEDKGGGREGGGGGEGLLSLIVYRPSSF